VILLNTINKPIALRMNVEFAVGTMKEGAMCPLTSRGPFHIKSKKGPAAYELEMLQGW
jgi:hypothetical protein